MNNVIEAKKRNLGISIIEFIVAVGILTIITGAGTTAILGALISNKGAETHTKALGIANEGIEATRAIKNNSWGDLVNGVYEVEYQDPYWTLIPYTGNLIQNKFSRMISIEDTNIGDGIQWEIKKVEATVNWSQSEQRTGTVKIGTYFTDWRTARAAIPGGPAYGTCNDFCASLGYRDGSCWAFGFWCSLFGRTYIPYGSQFCSGTWSNVCCCRS